MLKRYEENPLIAPKDFPHGIADAVFNCGQTMYDGKTILLLSVVQRGERYPSIYVAESTDGIKFNIHAEPLIERIQEGSFKDFDIWPIDSRVTKIEDTYYIVRPGNDGGGIACIAYMYKTKDFKKAEFVECISLPYNRVPCLFPEKINGYYARLDRPFAQGADNEHGSIWISFSPDLIHWGQHRFLMTGHMYWNFTKVGPTPPIKTEKGWLVIIHGAAKNCSATRYSLGAMLLDLNDPTKIIGCMESYILTPEMDYEFMGWVPDVVFSCGAIPDYEKRTIRVYYGAADTCICLAEGSMDEIIDACLKGL